MIYNAADYDTIEQAIAAARHRHLYLPYDLGGKHTTPGWYGADGRGLVIPHGMELSGDGRLGELEGVRFRSMDECGITVEATDGDLHIHSLSVAGPWAGAGNGSGSAIAFTGKTKLGQVLIERVATMYAGDCGLLCAPAPNAPGDWNFCVEFDVRNSAFLYSGRNGWRVDVAATTIRSRDVNLDGSRQQGLAVAGCSTSEFDVLVEGCCSEAKAGVAPIEIHDSSNVVLRAYCEQNTLYSQTVKTIISLVSCGSCKVEAGGAIYEDPKKTGLTGLSLANCWNCMVEPCQVQGIETAVHLDSGCRGNVVHRWPVGKMVGDWSKNKLL